MGRRLLLNLLLVAVAAGLALFIYLQPGKAPQPEPAAMSDIVADAVTTIRLTRQQAEPVAFSRRDGRWFIQAEPELPADAFQVNTVLALASATTDRQYPARDLDLASMGLSPAQATAVLDDTRFDIGTTDPLDKRRYVMTGNTVYLVPDRYQHLLNARYTNFVERRLLPTDATVTSLTLPQLSLTLTADNLWQLQPTDPAVSADAIRALVSAWENAQALYVREYTGEPGEAVRTRLADSADSLDWVLLKTEADIVLARPDWGIQYHLPVEAGRKLLELTEIPQEQP